ncbi:MAG TPA: GMC oxidoreductase, partial [Woeseiaceae bacterium]|nr:GMC oxidoreductase [Woeseiaceae bacterium]
GRGCSIGAAFQTTTSLLPMAKRTGLLEIRTDAMVSALEVDAGGAVTAVRYVDRATGTERTASGRAVVLAASACESARILLNSRNDRFPAGVANSSGQVGRNLMDSTGADLGALVPALMGRPRYNEDGHTSNHVFVPWWGHAAQLKGALDFPRGYHLELGTGFDEPDAGIGAGAEGYGRELKQAVRDRYGAWVHFALRGEMLPNEHCYMDIDETVRDKWGIPVPRFHWRWSEHELRQVAHGLSTMRALIELMGGATGELPAPGDAIRKGGEIIHEVGTTRMGTSRTDSVTDRWGKAWDLSNLYVMDGGVFASNPHKNCTLTLMTLAMRNADRLAGELGRRAA